MIATVGSATAARATAEVNKTAKKLLATRWGPSSRNRGPGCPTAAAKLVESRLEGLGHWVGPPLAFPSPTVVASRAAPALREMSNLVIERSAAVGPAPMLPPGLDADYAALRQLPIFDGIPNNELAAALSSQQ